MIGQLAVPRQTVKRKNRRPSQPVAEEVDLPEWLQEQRDPRPNTYPNQQWLDQVSAGTEKGIRDTAAWKNLVRRVGLKKARRILRIGLLRWQDPPANPGT